MQLWRSMAIEAYRCTTLPYRVVRLRQRMRRANVPIAILFYHRVADYDPTPWTISCAGFRRQMQWLRRRFELISLDEAQRRLAEGNRRPAVCITFDDGYEDNADFALPLLASWDIPTTYFVSQGFLDQSRPFPHDEQLGLELTPNRIDTLRRWIGGCIELGGHTREHLDLGKVQDIDRLYDEIVAASHELGEQLGVSIRHFAFPFGQPSHLSSVAIEIARQAGLKSVSSAYGGWNWVGSAGFHLQRMHGDPHLVRLKNWLSGDPRTLGVSPPELLNSDASQAQVSSYLERLESAKQSHNPAPVAPLSCPSPVSIPHSIDA